MSKFIGRLADIGIAKETTRGTAESAATFWLPKMSLTYDDTIDQVIDESSVGVIEDSTDAKVVGKHASGEFEGKIGDKSIGLLLLGTFGTVTTTGGGQTNVYSHTFAVQEDAQTDSLTVFQDDPNQDYKYANGMIDSMAIDVMIGEFSKVTIGLRSKVGATASVSPSYTAENNFLPQHATLKYATTQAGLGAGTEVAVRSVQMSISKNVEDDMKLGSLSPADILNKQLAIEGTLELVFNDETFKTQLLADTALAIRLRMTNTDVTIGTSLNPQLTIDLYKVKFSEVARNYDNNEIVTVTVAFKAHYSISDSSMVTIELINGQSSY